MKAKEVYMYILGALIVLGVFIITWFFLYKEMPPANKEIMFTIVGVMLAKFADVIGYFFGSSKGSSDKNEMFKKQQNEVKPPAV